MYAAWVSTKIISVDYKYNHVNVSICQFFVIFSSLIGIRTKLKYLSHDQFKAKTL